MPGSLGTDQYTAAALQCGLTQPQFVRRLQNRRTRQRPIKQTVITRLGKAYSLHQRCTCAIHSQGPQKQNRHQGARAVLCLTSCLLPVVTMHPTCSYLNQPVACTGPVVSCQRTPHQRVAHQSAVSCSASAVDQFGRSNDASLQSGVPAVLSNLQALYQFSRPHTMLGTFISICSVSLLAMVRSDMVWMHIAYCFLTLSML